MVKMETGDIFGQDSGFALMARFDLISSIVLEREYHVHASAEQINLT